MAPESPGESRWPKPLEPVSGPYPEAKLAGVVAGMGDEAPAMVALMERGLLSPDMMTQLSLYLLARQPRRSKAAGTEAGTTPKKGAPGVSGRIWARERVTYHAPLAADAPFTIEGESIGRHVRKGRRYATTASRTVDTNGVPVATNLTTGLLSYRADETLADDVEGCPSSEMPIPEPDWSECAKNPHLEALAEAREGEVLGGKPMVMSLAMMAARDTDNPDNPIHSDPEIAKAAGLAKPIAGGSHVQAFALEQLMARFGPEVLLHGACVDTRWKAPTEAEARMIPQATITEVSADRIVAEIEVRLEAGPVAMVGQVVIPRPA